MNLGGTNYGVEAAAQYYWGISRSDLSVAHRPFSRVWCSHRTPMTQQPTPIWRVNAAMWCLAPCFVTVRFHSKNTMKPLHRLLLQCSSA